MWVLEQDKGIALRRAFLSVVLSAVETNQDRCRIIERRQMNFHVSGAKLSLRNGACFVLSGILWNVSQIIAITLNIKYIILPCSSNFCLYYVIMSEISCLGGRNPLQKPFENAEFHHRAHGAHHIICPALFLVSMCCLCLYSDPLGSRAASLKWWYSDPLGSRAVSLK